MPPWVPQPTSYGTFASDLGGRARKESIGVKARAFWWGAHGTDTAAMGGVGGVTVTGGRSAVSFV